MLIQTKSHIGQGECHTQDSVHFHVGQLLEAQASVPQRCAPHSSAAGQQTGPKSQYVQGEKEGLDGEAPS